MLRGWFTKFSIWLTNKFDDIDDMWYLTSMALAYVTRWIPLADFISSWGFYMPHAYWAASGQFFLYLIKIRLPGVFGQKEEHKVGTKILYFCIDMVVSGFFGLIGTAFIVDDVSVTTPKIAFTCILIGAFYETIAKVGFKWMVKFIEEKGNTDKKNN